MLRLSYQKRVIRFLIVFAICWFIIATLIICGIIEINGSNDDKADHILKTLDEATVLMQGIQHTDDNIKQGLLTYMLKIEKFLIGHAGNGSIPSSAKQELALAKNLFAKDVSTLTDIGSIPLNSQFLRKFHYLQNDIKEVNFFSTAQLLKVIKAVGESSEIGKKLSVILEGMEDRIRVTQLDFKSLQNHEELYNWRKKEASVLSNLIQKRFHFLQNPPDCSTAKKIVCNLNKGCGYGCQLHHAVYCMIMAYGTQRTLILKSANWRYNNKGFEDVFLPLSDTCTDSSGSSQGPWPADPNVQVISLPIIDSLTPRPGFLPLAVPKDLYDRITGISGAPYVWWIGQFLKFLLRPQPQTQKMLEDVEAKLGFKKPIVGIHVRRTDKVGTEASFHSLQEYMVHVEEYFVRASLTSPVARRVYIASDDPSVLKEAKKNYPEYQFFGDLNVAHSAAVNFRYSENSLKGVIADVHFLSKCDFLVCTFSSQICRVAYEIMQSFDADAAFSYRSLDDSFYFGGQNAHDQKARFSHEAQNSNEIFFNVGDRIGIAGNHWDGFSKGTNRRTRKVGLYPSYKVEDVVEAADIPSF